MCEAAHVKGSLFSRSQTNHFETRWIMLQNRSYSIKSSVKLQPLLLERVASLSLLGSLEKETISTHVIRTEVPSRLTQAFTTRTEVAVFEAVLLLSVLL